MILSYDLSGSRSSEKILFFAGLSFAIIISHAIRSHCNPCYGMIRDVPRIIPGLPRHRKSPCGLLPSHHRYGIVFPSCSCFTSDLRSFRQGMPDDLLRLQWSSQYTYPLSSICVISFLQSKLMSQLSLHISQNPQCTTPDQSSPHVGSEELLGYILRQRFQLFREWITMYGKSR